MGMSIKNAEVERMARELAEQRGISMTEAIRQSLAEALDKGDKAKAKLDLEERRRRVMEIIDRIDAMPRLVTDMTDNEILGYDEYGLPN